MDVPMCATQHFLQEQLFFVLHLYYYFCYWMMVDSSTTLCLQIAFKSTKLCSRLQVPVHAVMSWMKVKRLGWRLKYLLIHLLVYIRIHSSSSNPHRQGDHVPTYVLTTESQSMSSSCVSVDTTKKEGRTGWATNASHSLVMMLSVAFSQALPFPSPFLVHVGRAFTLQPYLCSVAHRLSCQPDSPFLQSSPIHRYRYYTLTANRIAATVELTLAILFYCQVPVYSTLPTFIRPPPEPVSACKARPTDPKSSSIHQPLYGDEQQQDSSQVKLP